MHEHPDDIDRTPHAKNYTKIGKAIQDIEEPGSDVRQDWVKKENTQPGNEKQNMPQKRQ